MSDHPTASQIIHSPSHVPGLSHLELLTSRWTNPPLAYHNVTHCLNVAGRAWAGASAYGLDPVELTLAGLFHDANHPGLPADDDNIVAALAAWGEDGDERVAWLIEATRFPHTRTHRHTGDTGLTRSAEVLRDADLLEAICNLGMLERLAAETGRDDLAQDAMTSWLSTTWARGIARTALGLA